MGGVVHHVDRHDQVVALCRVLTEIHRLVDIEHRAGQLWPGSEILLGLGEKQIGHIRETVFAQVFFKHRQQVPGCRTGASTDFQHPQVATCARQRFGSLRQCAVQAVQHRVIAVEGLNDGIAVTEQQAQRRTITAQQFCVLFDTGVKVRAKRLAPLGVGEPLVSGLKRLNGQGQIVLAVLLHATLLAEHCQPLAQQARKLRLRAQSGHHLCQVMTLPGFTEQPVFLQGAQNAFTSAAFQRLPGQVNFQALRLTQLRQLAQRQWQRSAQRFIDRTR